MQSAITSRDTSEYFMPIVPMEMASDTVGVPNVCGARPASRHAASARFTRTWRPALQGVVVLWAFAIPTNGFLKSSSV